VYPIILGKYLSPWGNPPEEAAGMMMNVGERRMGVAKNAPSSPAVSPQGRFQL